MADQNTILNAVLDAYDKVKSDNVALSQEIIKLRDKIKRLEAASEDTPESEKDKN